MPSKFIFVDSKVTEYIIFLELALSVFCMNLLKWRESKKRKRYEEERQKEHR